MLAPILCVAHLPAGSHLPNHVVLGAVMVLQHTTGSMIHLPVQQLYTDTGQAPLDASTG